MSQASEYAKRWQEVMGRHPGAYATPAELDYIGPCLSWSPTGCNWAAMVTPAGTLALADPEIGGAGGPFRTLTPEEISERNAWVVEVFGSDPAPLNRSFKDC